MRSAEEWLSRRGKIGRTFEGQVVNGLSADNVRDIQRDAFEAGARAAIRYCDERAPIPGMDSRLDVEFTAEELAAREFDDA